MTEAPDVRALLGALRAGEEPGIVVVVAHPDDEVLGLGSLLPRLRRAALIHLTDGAPDNMVDARLHGFADRLSYARARRREVEAALALAGWGADRLHELGIADQQAPLDLAGLARRLAERLAAMAPRYVITHAYEGGHQDHDAAAFGVHAACRLLARAGRPAPGIVEFALYRFRDGRIAAFDFVPWPGRPPVTVKLCRADRALKSRMRRCFATQQAVLRQFPNDVERLRAAPPYDFTRPPHPGRLHYERFAWAMRGGAWRALARDALRTLGLEEPAAAGAR